LLNYYYYFQSRFIISFLHLIILKITLGQHP